MKLTDAIVRASRYSEKPEKLRDGNGLYLHVMPSGKYWRYDYRYQGKRKTLSIGVYPRVSLKSARSGLQAAKDQLAQGIDPSYQKQLVKNVNDDHRFRVVAMDWLRRHDCADRSRKDIQARFDNDVFPLIGDMIVGQIRPIDVMNVGRRIESRGANEVARRVIGNISHVMRYSVSLGLVDDDPCRDLKGAIRRKRRVKHYPAITNRVDFGKLLRDIDTYSLNMVIAHALKLAPYVALRPGELRGGLWTEIDWTNDSWIIPAERMKKGREHIVPLSKQARDILESTHKMTGSSQWIFRSTHTGKNQPISENTVNIALGRLGYTGKHVAHGFRSSFSTITNETGLYSTDAVEIQLAHMDKDRVRAAYHRSIHLDTRREMMQWWADQVDAMRLDRGNP